MCVGGGGDFRYLLMKTYRGGTRDIVETKRERTDRQRQTEIGS